MTTIAFDGRFLACDSQRTSGSCITGSKEQKLFRLSSKQFGRELYLAAGGSIAMIRRVYTWIEHGGEVPPFTNDDFDGMIVDVDGKNPAELFPGGVLHPIAGNWVGGSGYMVALTAMHLGLNAIDAVRTAVELDAYTGGDVTWVDLGMGE